jgi:predicted AAA+ superfamily ATPase
MDLPPRQSAFLWGARKTGKSTYLKTLFPNAIFYDFLQTDHFQRFLQAPHHLREEVLALKSEAQIIILDEVQKIPPLLDEVHWLIENTQHQFILCGSSARKLKRGGANLLGGRAWRFIMPPLVYPEIPDFDLLRALNHGLLPSHYLSPQPKRSLTAYIGDYLKEEIQAEGLTRNLPAFSKFLETAAFCNGELINYSNIAQDCGVDAKTIREYFQILIDTYLGHIIYPFQKRLKRELITKAPKFYFFDVGIANRLMHSTLETLQGALAGKAFEHWIFMELMAYIQLKEKDHRITFWRSKTGLEVDFIIGDNIAIEVKISADPKPQDLKGLLAFCEEHAVEQAYVVCTAPRARLLSQYPPIRITPWQMFITALWAGEYF